MSPLEKRSLGIYAKFAVIRADREDGPGGKHENCRLFVLDVSCDPHARPAIRAYAESCGRDGYAALSQDLYGMLGETDPATLKAIEEAGDRREYPIAWPPDYLSRKAPAYDTKDGSFLGMLPVAECFDGPQDYLARRRQELVALAVEVFAEQLLFGASEADVARQMYALGDEAAMHMGEG